MSELAERPETALATVPRKIAWQRAERDRFKAEHGYSLTTHYSAGGRRKEVLERDGYACVECGMTDDEHKAKWGRPITVDHKNRDRSNNAPENLQTLCLTCHGRKDFLPHLRVPKVPEHKATILQRRADGDTFQEIANDLGFSVAAIWKWCKRWEAQ